MGETFLKKLFKLRKEKGLSQEALAEKINTTRQAISKWENGQGYPETEMATWVQLCCLIQSTNCNRNTVLVENV